MLNNDKFKNTSTLLNENRRTIMKEYFNPYEYNFDFTKKEVNTDSVKMQSESHQERSINKKA